MNIEVGDKVTYDNGYVEIICEDDDINYQTVVKNRKIVKVERPKWEVVEEKKELLTEEEREFLKIHTKFNKIKYDKIRFCTDCVEFWSDISITSYHTKNKFKNIELGRFYGKKELRIRGRA